MPLANFAATPAASAAPADLLTIDDLRVSFGAVEAVRGVSLTVSRGEIVGLVGESGSGKSLTALSILGLAPADARVRGQIRLGPSGSVGSEDRATGRAERPKEPARRSQRSPYLGEDLLTLPPRRLRQVRGGRVGMIFQEPASALNPVFSIGFQVAEALRAHRLLSRKEARDEAVRLLDRVALAEPRRRLADYPHQLSGGQRQRVMIAMALAAGPDLLLADEPTTALDVTVQAQILALLLRLRDELGLAVLLITHDFGVVAETCDRAIVLYAGEVVEEAPVGELLARPEHPYTRALLASLPRLDAASAASAGHRQPLPAIPGQPPAPGDLPVGCAFVPRCAEAFAPCQGERPDLYAIGGSGPVEPCGPAPSGAPRSQSPVLGAQRGQRRARCFLHRPQVPPEAPR
jgi:oligopeptide/dipeptide ABC transporter ATP-binding protein